MFAISSHLETTENSQVNWLHVRVSFGTEGIIDSRKKIARAKFTAVLVRHLESIWVKNTVVTRTKNSCSLSWKSVSIKDAGIKSVQGKVLSCQLNTRGNFYDIRLFCGAFPTRKLYTVYSRQFGIFRSLFNVVYCCFLMRYLSFLHLG